MSIADILIYLNLYIFEISSPQNLALVFRMRLPWGAMHIPHDEMEARYNEIPSGKPVILHCGGGIVSVNAYNILMEKRKDIPQLSYIAGAPLVSSYNEWLASEGK